MQFTLPHPLNVVAPRHTQILSLRLDIKWRSRVLESNTHCMLKNTLHF